MSHEQSTVWQIDEAAGLALLRRVNAQPLPPTAEYRQWLDASSGPGDRSPMRYAGDIAVIDVQGLLTKRRGMVQWYYGNFSTQEIAAALAEAVGSPNVSGVMLRIDSPGGTVDGLAELTDAVWAARKAKPVMAVVNGLAASAAYRVASQAHAIVAGRGDLIGSVGTISVMYDMSRMAEKDGVEAVVFSTGFMKGAGVPGAPITDEQRAELQRVVDRMQQDFEADLRRGRGMTEAQVRKIATGQIWQAEDAIGLRLIDRVGGQADAMAEIGRMARARRREDRASQSATGSGTDAEPGEITTLGALTARIAALSAET